MTTLQAALAEEREALAAIEHEQWITWAEAVMPEVDGLRAERWHDYMVPYADLPEDVKDHDRKWADKVLAALAAHDEQVRAAERERLRKRFRYNLALTNPPTDDEARARRLIIETVVLAILADPEQDHAAR